MEFQPVFTSVSPPNVSVAPGLLIATVDGTFWVDTEDYGRIGFSGLVQCASITERDAIPTALRSKGKLYCVAQVGDKDDLLYRWSGTAFVEVAKADPPVVQLPNLAAYEALSAAEKNNGALYLIEEASDVVCNIIEAVNDTTAQALSQVNPGNVYFVEDV